MSQPFKLAKLLGAQQLVWHESGEALPTEQIQQPNTVIGLYFACSSAHEDLSKTKEFSESLAEFYRHMQELSTDASSTSSSPSSSSSASSSSTISPDDDYEEHAQTKASTVLSFSFQVIMISFDDSEKRITPISKESQHSTPFLIFNGDDKSKRLQEYLIQKYHVQTAPTLILLDASSGHVINFEGVAKISGDAELLKKQIDFPWRHPSCSDILFSGQLVRTKQVAESLTPSGIILEKLEASSVLQKTAGIRGLLFSAYWCPPCRVLVDQLKEVYQRLKDSFNFEVVFVSSDRSQDSFERFMAYMPWCAIPFSEEQRRLQLTAALNIRAIPTLIIMDSDDKIITAEGRERLMDDLDAIDFPWPIKLVEELHDRHSSILNHSTCLIYFIGDEENEYDKIEATLEPIATQISESTVEEAFEIKFFIATDSELSESLRLFIDLEDSASNILILDIPKCRYSITSPLQSHDKKLVIDLIQKFQNSQLEYFYINSEFV